jgi:YD repeat-containing protein
MKKNMREGSGMELNPQDLEFDAAEQERQLKFDEALGQIAKPERGFLAADEQVAGLKKETIIEGDKARSQVFFNPENKDQILASKDIYYKKEKGEDGTHHETEEIKSATERKFDYDDQGRVVGETGTNLHAEGSWQISGREFDDENRVTFERVEQTEGAHAFEQRGNYSKESINIVGKHYVERDGQRVLEDYTREKYQFRDKDGKVVYGWSQEYDKDKKSTDKGYMKWPEKAEDIPSDFKEW